jgi:hypothetical protein
VSDGEADGEAEVEALPEANADVEAEVEPEAANVHQEITAVPSDESDDDMPELVDLPDDLSQNLILSNPLWGGVEMYQADDTPSCPPCGHITDSKYKMNKHK